MASIQKIGALQELASGAPWNTTVPSQGYINFRVRLGQRVVISPKNSLGPGEGWAHRVNIPVFGPVGSGEMPPESEAWPRARFARPEMPVGALVAGYHFEDLSSLDEKQFFALFREGPGDRRILNIGGRHQDFGAEINGYIYLIMNDALYWPHNTNQEGYIDNLGYIGVSITTF